MLYHFHCPECDYDDKEHGGGLGGGLILCPLCLEDSGHRVPLIFTEPIEDKE